MGDFDASGPVPLTNTAVFKTDCDGICKAIIGAVIAQIFVVGSGFNPGGGTKTIDEGIDIIDKKEGWWTRYGNIKEDFGTLPSARSEAGEKCGYEVPVWAVCRLSAR